LRGVRQPQLGEIIIDGPHRLAQVIRAIFRVARGRLIPRGMPEKSGSERAERLGEQFGAVARIAAQKPHGTVGNDRNKAVPVVFDLVQPTLTIRRLGSCRDNLEPDSLRQISRDRPRREARISTSG
jgi:hypothetical protein